MHMSVQKRCLKICRMKQVMKRHGQSTEGKAHLYKDHRYTAPKALLFGHPEVNDMFTDTQIFW